MKLGRRRCPGRLGGGGSLSLSEDLSKLSEIDHAVHKRWKADSVKMRDKLGIPLNFKPYSQGAPARGLAGVEHSSRVIELLNIAEADRLMCKIPLQGFWVDVSQGVLRRCWGELKTFSPGALLFDMELGRLAPPSVALVLNGFPTVAVEESFGDDGRPQFPSGLTLGRLAGQCSNLPCLGACLLAYFLNSHAPWWRPKADG